MEFPNNLADKTERKRLLQNVVILQYTATISMIFIQYIVEI